MWAYQLGSKIAIPDMPFMTFILQYTKIEPYTYTHPLTDTPGYTEKMNTNYINHGEPLGYKLKPNSAEIKIGLRTSPLWFCTLTPNIALFSTVRTTVRASCTAVHTAKEWFIM